MLLTWQLTCQVGASHQQLDPITVCNIEAKNNNINTQQQDAQQRGTGSITGGTAMGWNSYIVTSGRLLSEVRSASRDNVKSLKVTAYVWPCPFLVGLPKEKEGRKRLT